MMRRCVAGALALLLILSVIGWIFYIPQSVLQTLTPVPSHAQIVYQCDAFDRAEMEKCPASGVSKNEDRFLQWLEKSPLTVASVALGGRDRRDTWVAVSAIGPRAVLLRWKLKLFPPEGIKPLRSYGAWPVWQYSDSSFPVWMCIRFSLSEGLLICSISDDSHDIYYLLDTLDGRRPSAERKEN